MNHYICSWEIDVHADTPQEAARHAEDLFTRRTASVWTVRRPRGKKILVDIMELEDPPTDPGGARR